MSDLSSAVSQLDTATRGHHPDSPSSLQASDACPHFENEQRTSAASEAGTLQHKAVETRDLSILGGDEAMEQAVQDAILYEDAIVSSFRLAGEPFEVVREKRLQVGDDVVLDKDGKPHTGITGGFADLEIVGVRRAAQVDDKFGKVPVTPTKDNLQAQAYALGRFQASPSIEEIEFHFFAPYQGWSEEQQRKLYVHTFYRREADKLELRIRTVVARKRQATENEKRNDWSMACPKHDLCIWCAKKAKCPKVGALIVVGHSKYSDLEVPEILKEYQLTRPDQIAAAYRFANQLATICEAVKKRCIDAAVTEGALPEGFTIVKSQRREVKNPRTVIEQAIDAGLSEDEAVALVSTPLTKFEEAIKAKAPKGKAAAKVRQFSQALEEHGATEMGKPFYFLREVKTPAQKSEVIEIKTS